MKISSTLCKISFWSQPDWKKEHAIILVYVGLLHFVFWEGVYLSAALNSFLYLQASR